jgi:hypothetical protein
MNNDDLIRRLTNELELSCVNFMKRNEPFTAEDYLEIVISAHISALVRQIDFIKEMLGFASNKEMLENFREGLINYISHNKLFKTPAREIYDH